jgi:cytochrome c oxidase cbb3-type subunit III
MRRGEFTILIAATAMVAMWTMPARVGAQDEHGVTPADIERGGQTFLASCAVCHGPDGDTIPGVNLASGTFRHATTDQELVNVIRNGIPGTAMPPNNLTEAQAGLVAAYLRSLPAAILTSKTAGLQGNPVSGKAIFDGKGGCGGCHMTNGAGGFLGPDLSSVGLTRRSIELERAMTDPDADIRTGNRTVKVVAKDGVTTIARLLNQDTYSLQMIDAKGNLMAVMKDGVRSWEIMNGSAMPKLTDKLSAQEMADVVSYLGTMKTPPPAGAAGPGGRGGGGGGGGRGGGAPVGPPAGPGGGGGRGGRGGAQ